MNTVVEPSRQPLALRGLNGLFCLAMFGFAAVQYNDPDAALWVMLYGVPALWAYLAAMRVASLKTRDARALLWITVAVGLGIVISYWPQMPNFWIKDVWWVEETAREGMGLMIAWLGLLVALYTASRS